MGPSPPLHPDVIEQYRDDHPKSTIFVFVLFYAVSVIAAFPSLPLNLAGGFFWGALAGGVYSTIGATLGGWISFLAARHLLGALLTEHFETKWATHVHKEFQRNGWRFVALARLSPVIPTGPLNYLLGLTSLSNRDFLWATFIFLLPPAIAIAYIGDTLQTFSAERADVTDAVVRIVCVSAVITFVPLVKVAYSMFAYASGKHQPDS